MTKDEAIDIVENHQRGYYCAGCIDDEWFIKIPKYNLVSSKDIQKEINLFLIEIERMAKTCRAMHRQEKGAIYYQDMVRRLNKRIGQHFNAISTRKNGTRIFWKNIPLQRLKNSRLTYLKVASMFDTLRAEFLEAVE